MFSYFSNSITYFKEIFVTESKKFNLFILSTFTLQIILLFFSNEIPLFFSWGNEFENLASSFCLSIMSSYIFFILLIMRKERKDKANVNVVMELKLSSLFNYYENKINSFKVRTQIDNEFTELTENDFKLFYGLIGTNVPTNQSTFYLVDGTIKDKTFEDLARDIALKFERLIIEVTPLFPIIDTEIVKTLILLQDSSFMNNCLIKDLSLKTFSNLGKHFYDFNQLVVELKNVYHLKIENIK